MRSEAQAVEGDKSRATTPLTLLSAALDALTEGTGNPKMHIQQVRLLVHVAACGEVLQADLAEIVGIAQSSVSHNVALLGNGVKPDEPGYGLLESEEVPHYRRAKVVRLTEKGKVLAWDMQQAFAGIVPRASQSQSQGSHS